MTAPSGIDPARFLHEQLDQASPDLLRQMLTPFINTLMSAEADAVYGAEYGVSQSPRSGAHRFDLVGTELAVGGHDGHVERLCLRDDQPVERVPMVLG
jgi:hypothetical protein